jgi:hypothetical protein
MSGPQVVAGSHSHGAGSADVALLPAKGAVLTVGADGVAVAAGLEIKNEKSSPFTCAVVNPEKGTVVLGDQNAFVKVRLCRRPPAHSNCCGWRRLALVGWL